MINLKKLTYPFAMDEQFSHEQFSPDPFWRGMRIDIPHTKYENVIKATLTHIEKPLRLQLHSGVKTTVGYGFKRDHG